MSGAAALSRVYILGAGKVGRTVRRALREGGTSVTLRSARKGWPQRLSAEVVLLCVRDGELGAFAERFAEVRAAGPLVLLHCAGALTPEVLRAAERPGVSVGQWHPLLSFADPRHPPALAGAFVHIAGAEAAQQRARQLCGLLQMRAVSVPGLDPTLYHAGAALLANGLAALLEAAVTTLCRAGIDRLDAQQMLTPLLLSVAHNVQRQGVPEALSGPVRRGAGATIEAHLDALDRQVPEAHALYRALVRAQLPMAARLGEADAEALERIEHLLSARPGSEGG